MRSLITLAALALSSQLVAQQAAQTNPTNSVQTPRDTTIRTPGTAADVARNREATRDPAVRAPHHIMRASKIIGTTVKNKADEELGSIDDIVIDPTDGRVLYAAVSMGGFLGVGDKLFAVPWEAIECREVDGEHLAYLDIDKQRMVNAQGFDQENWPDMANERWRAENDRRYQSTRKQHEVFRPVQPVQPGNQSVPQPRTQPQPVQPQSASQQPQDQ